MIRHTVSFRLIHPADSAAEAEFLSTAQSTLSAIPGVQDFTISRQVSPKSDHGFQFSMVFDDQAAYDAYNTHPDHVQFVSTRWAGDVADFAELDLVPYSG